MLVSPADTTLRLTGLVERLVERVESLELATRWNQQQQGRGYPSGGVGCRQSQVPRRAVGIVGSRDILAGGALRPDSPPARETKHP